MYLPAALALLAFPLLALSAPSANHLSQSGEQELETARWSIKNFSRNVTLPTTGTYNFGIDNGVDPNPIPCSIVDTVAAPKNASSNSWYNVGCKEAPDYHISWGWDYANDFTVMTVLHWPSQQEAFFGYAHPNAAGPVTTYKDAGPNAVQNV